MGQKVNPHGYRVGVIKNWDSRWFANDTNFGDTLVEDYNLRKYLKKTLFTAGIAKVEIERDDKRVRLHIHCAKPGMVIGRNGAEIEKLRARCQEMLGKPVIVNIGRLGGAEIARSERYHEGTIPLQTLRADIDYGFAEANTTYGIIGVKVWIYRGEVLNENRRTNKRQGGSR